MDVERYNTSTWPDTRVIVINTGTELLLGDVLNSHLSFIAREIFPLGLRIERQLAVPDGAAIRAALADSSTQADIIFVTGGLGPTTDDVLGRSRLNSWDWNCGTMRRLWLRSLLERRAADSN